MCGRGSCGLEGGDTGVSGTEGVRKQTREVSGPSTVPIDDKVTQDFSRGQGGNENRELKIMAKNLKNVVGCPGIPC